MNINKSQALSDISLICVLSFFKQHWRSLLLFSIVGLLASIVFVSLKPHQYEAVIQIKMASADGKMIEAPLLLAERLRLPSTYTAKVEESCGLSNDKQNYSILPKLIYAFPLRGIDSVVEVRVRGTTPERTAKCSDAVFEMISSQQHQQLLPTIDRLQDKVKDYQSSLENKKNLFKNPEKLTIASLILRDEIKWEQDQISFLQDKLFSYEQDATKLIAPIYLMGDMKLLNRTVYFIFGGILGLVVGILFILWRKYKVSYNSR